MMDKIIVTEKHDINQLTLNSISNLSHHFKHWSQTQVVYTCKYISLSKLFLIHCQCIWSMTSIPPSHIYHCKNQAKKPKMFIQIWTDTVVASDIVYTVYMTVFVLGRLLPKLASSSQLNSKHNT